MTPAILIEMLASYGWPTDLHNLRDQPPMLKTRGG